MLWIWQQKSNNINDLHSHIWDEWADENGSIGKAYGYQMSVKHQYKEGMMDQVDRAVMEKMAARAMEQDYYIDEDGNKVYYENGTYYIDGIEIEDRPLTQEEVNEVMAIIDTIDSSIYYDNDLYSIIHEELEFFYNGQKSAADTAAMIQSRAFVYVNEQR